MLQIGLDGRTVPGAASSRIPCKESISVKHAGDAKTVAVAPAIQIQNTLSPANSDYNVILEDEDHTHQTHGEIGLHWFPRRISLWLDSLWPNIRNSPNASLLLLLEFTAKLQEL